MSKVAIIGNASGTGVFTVASPNSNVDRVLTLPDETGTVLTTTGTIPTGTANGVTYLNGSKALTSGSALTFDGTNLGIGTSSPSGKLVVAGSLGNVSVSAAGVQLDFSRAGSNYIRATNATGELRFGTGANSDRMVLDSSGNLLVGKTSITTLGNGAFFRIGAYSSITTVSDSCLVLNRETSTGDIQAFRYNNTQVGSISVTGSTTSYNTSSDYRLKEDWQPMTGATERVQALKPVNFAWKVDGSRVDGFLAHEAQEVVPECVTGAKDAMDAEGKPNYQGIDQSKLVPLLTAALQEALTKIDALTARITALETAP